MSYKVKMVFPVVGMLLLLGYAALALSNMTTIRPTSFVGGTFEASGVASVPGTDSVLFVDDGRPGDVFWMRLDEAGKQAGDELVAATPAEHSPDPGDSASADRLVAKESPQILGQFVGCRVATA